MPFALVGAVIGAISNVVASALFFAMFAPEFPRTPTWGACAIQGLLGGVVAGLAAPRVRTDAIVLILPALVSLGFQRLVAIDLCRRFQPADVHGAARAVMTTTIVAAVVTGLAILKFGRHPARVGGDRSHEPLIVSSASEWDASAAEKH